MAKVTVFTGREYTLDYMDQSFKDILKEIKDERLKAIIKYDVRNHCETEEEYSEIFQKVKEQFKFYFDFDDKWAISGGFKRVKGKEMITIEPIPLTDEEYEQHKLP